MKTNTLPKRPPAIAAMLGRIASHDLPAADWSDERPTVCVVIRRELARAVKRTDTPDMPDLFRYSLAVMGRDTAIPWRNFDTEQEAMSCLEVLRLRPVTPRICLELGFKV